eukprot:182961_1
MLRRTCQVSFRQIKQALKQQTCNKMLLISQPSSYRIIHSSPSMRSAAHPVMPPPAHIDMPNNTVDTPFDYTSEEYEEIRKILAKYPSNYKQSGTIPLLWIAQRHCGNWVPLAAMNKIAEILEIHPMRVYEVATFYTMFNRQKIGKYHLQVCGTTPCMVRGSDEVFRAIQDYAGIHQGQTSKDKMFTCHEVECLACCANAPMMQVNNEEVYEDLDYENTKQLLSDLKEGNAKIGSQSGRNMAEGIQGRTTLLNGAPPPSCRDFDKLKKDIEEEAKKKAQEAKQ